MLSSQVGYYLQLIRLILQRFSGLSHFKRKILLFSSEACLLSLYPYHNNISLTSSLTFDREYYPPEQNYYQLTFPFFLVFPLSKKLC